jgi:hypothetical protein
MTSRRPAVGRASWRMVVAGLVVLSALLPGAGPLPAGAGSCGSGRLSAGELGTVLGSRPDRMAGSDYARALPLGDDRVLWTFQDVFIGTDDDLRGDRFAHSAALLQEGRCFRLVHGGTAAQPAGWIGRGRDLPLRRWFWPLDATLGPDGLVRVVVAEMVNPNGTGAADGAVPVAAWLATVRPSDLAVLSLEPAPDPGSDLYGWSVVSDDHHSYLYSHCYRQFVADRSCGGEVRVARVPRGMLHVAPEYWTGSDWVADRSRATIVLRRPVVTPVSVERHAGRYVSVAKLDDWFGSELVVDVADHPAGPFVEVGRYPVAPRCDVCNTYGAHLLPWLDHSGDLLVVLSSNAWDMRISLRDGRLYRPAVVTLPLPQTVSPAATGSPLTLHPVVPTRLLDTRTGTGGRTGPLRAGEVLVVGSTTLRFPVLPSALYGNLVLTEPDAAGYLQAWPCDQARPPTSVLNAGPGQTVANGALLLLSATGELCLSSSMTTHVVLDATGYLLSDGSGLGLRARDPVRVLDTRAGRNPAAGETVRLDLVGGGHVPPSARAVTVTFTVTDAAGPGFVTVWPCDVPMPLASSVNAQPDVPRPNTITVPLAADGSVCAMASVELAMVVDAAGWWEVGGRSVRLESPRRAWDSRTEGLRVPANRQIAVPIGHTVGGAAPAALVNVVVTEGTAPGYLTVWPCAVPRPVASVANWITGSTSAANTLAVVDARSRMCVHASADVHLVVDVVGWLDP